MNDQNNILILGGTGAMGSNLVRILDESGIYHIVVTSRKHHEAKGTVEYRQGDAHDYEWLRTILSERKWDAIVDFMIYTTDEFKKRVELLLDATKQYVFTSSARVYADAGDSLITEESPRLLDVCTDQEYLKTDEYALTKARQENILINYPSKNWTIIRPYITFSDNRLQLGVMEKESWLIPALNDRPIVFSKDIANHYTTITDGLTVAKCIASLLTNPSALGEVFHITSIDSHKWQEILQWYIDAYQEVLGYYPKVYMTDIWNPYFGGGEYQWKYDRLYDRKFDNKKICQFVPDDTFKPTKESIKFALKTFVRLYQPTILDLNQEVEWERSVLTGQFLPIYKIRGKRRWLKTLAYKCHIYKPLKIISNFIWN